MKKNLLNGKRIELGKETIYEINLKNSPIGVALAEIRNSKEHFHKKTMEWYYVIEGNGELHLNGRKILLKKNDFLFIPAKSRHSVQNKDKKNLKILAITMPPWNKKDHYMV